ncbi:SDR family oxidoreductase [Haladaptatus sp. AB618]|uniref:SDR family oxidoreductase n=1 Tax=Haladaptatus sp. AB618 TaxID=2934173 RepID=UPI00209C019F|nr:SDR family oxidoreductase [Haladaptatus sp. AB618]MCO8255044.1 SDR family oxidoreductase [Haladaptatus sp. AB618]
MDGMLGGRSAVVTGAASGIGRAIARTFAEQGADVVVADVRDDPREDGAKTHERIEEETDAHAVFVQCDVSDPAAVTAAVDTAVDEFGGIDVMVNNAGIVGPTAPVTDIDPDAYQRLLDINLNGVFFGSQAAARRMREDDGGSIVNVSSIAGIQGYSDLSPYCASKGGIRLLTYSLAAELGADGIRVNAIHPGVIETAMTTEDVPTIGTESGEQMRQSIPLGRFGTPDDIADTALYLASDLASYVTGESIIVDGGMVNTA